MAFELLSLRRRGPMGAIVLIGAAGVAAGTGVWAQPSLVAAWPTSFEFDPLLTLAALAAMVGAAVWGLSIEWLYPDARGLIGGGAILGGGVAIGQSLLIASLHGPIEIDVGDTPIATAMALASAMAVGGLMVRRRRPGRIGQLAAVVCLTAATTASQGVERAAMMRATGFQAAVDPNALSAAALTPIAGVVIVAVLAAIALFANAVDLRPATRAPAWRGNPPPSPSPSRAGTRSPRPTPFR